jgi:hypothetical protein
MDLRHIKAEAKKIVRRLLHSQQEIMKTKTVAWVLTMQEATKTILELMKCQETKGYGWSSMHFSSWELMEVQEETNLLSCHEYPLA